MTKDQRWLLKMTKKPKFRWLRLLVLGTRNITSVIKYHWCIILNKLHLLERFNYRNEDERFVDTVVECSEPHRFRAVQCCYSVNLYDRVFSDIDYFHKAENKIVYVVRNDTRTTHLMRLTLKRIALVIDGKVYETKLPEVRVAVQHFEAYPLRRQDLTSPLPKFRTVNYDLTKLRRLMCEQVINDPDNPEEIQYAAEELSAQMSKALSEISFRDLEVKD